MAETNDPIITYGNLYGWRLWNVTPSPIVSIGDVLSFKRKKNVRLMSVGNGSSKAWESGLGVAECSLHGEGTVPHFHHHCGIWCYATLQDLMDEFLPSYASYPVIGMVRIFGNVVYHQTGVRAQYARPELLLVQPGWFPSLRRAESFARSLAQQYNCVTESINMVDFMEREMALEPAQRYPALCPPVDLTQRAMHPGEADLDALNWETIRESVKNRPAITSRDRDPGDGAGLHS